VSRPIKTRAIAPTGTIGILAETTTGIEPIFAKALKRRYLVEKTWHFQYVIDASVQRLVDQGVDPDTIEDAYDLAKDPGRRLDFQAWVQTYVDHGISSTLNLPAPAEQSFSHREFGDILIERLPLLRGVTVYPDGARGGQPLTTVPYAEAKDWVGFEYEEVGNGLACVSGACGI
jgi:ribonucleoside-diphosphate reductase alpha chain